MWIAVKRLSAISGVTGKPSARISSNTISPVAAADGSIQSIEP